MDYSMPLPIAATDVLINVVVEAVNDDDALLEEEPVSPATALTIYNVTFALSGQTWWVTFWLSGGIAGTLYNLRARWTLSDGRGSDTGGRIKCV